MASSLPPTPNCPDDEFTTAELPRMTAICPASTARQPLPGEVAVLGVGQGVQHGPAPLPGAQVHEAGRGGGGDAADAEVAGEVAGRQGAVRQEAVGAAPVARG